MYLVLSSLWHSVGMAQALINFEENLANSEISLFNFDNEFRTWADCRFFQATFDLSIEIVHQALSSDWNILLREGTDLSEIGNHVDSEGKIVAILCIFLFQVAEDSEN